MRVSIAQKKKDQLTYISAVPAGRQEVIVAFNFISECTVKTIQSLCVRVPNMTKVFRTFENDSNLYKISEVVIRASSVSAADRQFRYHVACVSVERKVFYNYILTINLIEIVARSLGSFQTTRSTIPLHKLNCHIQLK
jgi:hypothetical protein